MATAAVSRPECRQSPTAYAALKEHFTQHPEERLAHPHPWDVSRSDIYADNTWQPIFREMREAGPLHYIPESPFGPYWAVVQHKAIQHIESLPEIFSSSWEYGGITILNRLSEEEIATSGVDRRELPMFIAMDRPEHTGQRRTVAPKFTPSAMADMEGGDPPAHRRTARQPAARGDLRLGGPGLDRTDHRHARPALRLSMGRPPLADLLVGLGGRYGAGQRALARRDALGLPP